jgi:UDP-glucuronate 4-epimerase
MNIFITGCAGFIGSHVTEALLAAGHGLTGLDNFDPIYPRVQKEQNLRLSRQNPRFVFHEGDVRDARLVRRLIVETRPDAVVHLAAKAGVIPSIASPREYCDVNVGGTITLLDALKDVPGCRFVFGSSSSVYGNGETPFIETQPVAQPISPYAATKRSAELLCHTYHHLTGMPIHCLRFFTVYGPRQRPEMAISRFTRSIFQGDPIDLYSNGESSRDYTFIQDIVAGVLGSVERVAGFEIINLGGSTPVTLLQLVRTLENVTHLRAKTRLRPGQPGDVERTYASIARAHELLGYSPQTSLEDGLSQFVAWYRETALAGRT